MSFYKTDSSAKILPYYLILIPFIWLGISSCDITSPRSMGSLQVWLTDAPANYDAVYVDIQSIRIHKNVEAKTNRTETDQEAEESGWIIIPVDREPINLLELRNGTELALGEKEIASGTYKQIQFILGDENEIIIDGQPQPLERASAGHSGLTLSIDTEVEGGSISALLIDFDVARSVIKNEDNTYSLDPIMREVDLANSGTLTGSVRPVGFNTVVMAIANNDTLATITDEDGAFTILGVEPGTYDVLFQPSSDNFSPAMRSDVTISEQEEVDLGTILLDPSQS